MPYKRALARHTLLTILALVPLVLLVATPEARAQGARLQIQVTAEDGSPLAGIAFDLVAQDEEVSTVSGVETDKKGRVTLPSLREGMYQLELETPGYRFAHVELAVRDPGGQSAGDFAEDVQPGGKPAPFQTLQGHRMKMKVVLAAQEEQATTGAGQGSLFGAAGDEGELKALNDLFTRGEMEQLAVDAAAVVQVHPELGGAWYLLGVAQWRTGRLDEAVASFRKALELVPDQPGVRGALGSVLLNYGDSVAAQGDTEGARQAYEEAAPLLEAQVALTPDDPNFLTNHVVVLERLGRTDELVPAIKALLAVQPDDIRGYLRLSEIYVGQGKPDEAVAILDTIPHPDHAAAVAMYNIAVDLYNKEQYQEMLVVLNKALTIEPDSPDCHRLLGRAYLSMGDTPKAIAELKKYLELASDDDPNVPVERQLVEALEK